MTKRLESRREALQRDYSKGDIQEIEFLKTIGSLTGKKVGHQNIESQPPLAETPTEEATTPPVAAATGSEGDLPNQVIYDESHSLRFKINS